MNTPMLVRTFCLSALLSLASPLFAQDGPTPYPAPTNEAAWPGVGPIRCHPWMVDNRAWFWTQREKDQGAVVFVGDSLMVGWKTLQKDFPSLKVANRGIGGDVTRGMLFRFQEDVLDLHPRAIVMVAGSNDLSTLTAPANAIANISAIVDMARKANPDVPIILCTIPPRNAPKALLKPGALKELNARLTAFGAGKERFVVVDLFTALATPEGDITPGLFAADGIHLMPPAYVKWASLLRPALISLDVK